MSTVLALEHVFAKVSESFALDGINAVNDLGWRAKARHAQSALPRVIWVPGDDEGGTLGEIAAPRFPGQNPRPIALLKELATVYLVGNDPSAPEDERKQYHVTRMLFEAWFIAVYRAMHQNFRIRGQRWVTDKLERRFGTALRVVIELDAPVVEAMPDEPLVGGAFAGLSDAVDAVAAAEANDETFTHVLTTEIDEGDS